MRSSVFTSRAEDPGLRPCPLPTRRLPARPCGVGLRPLSDPRRRAGRGEVGGQGPALYFDCAFLPCSSESSKKNPKSRVQAAPSGGPLPWTSEPLFLLSG